MFDFKLIRIHLQPKELFYLIVLLRLEVGNFRFSLFDSFTDVEDNEIFGCAVRFIGVNDRSLFEINWTEWEKSIDIFFYRFKHKDSL